MSDLTPEQEARRQIDAMLGASGWAIQDYDRFNPSASRGIALREAPLKSGRCDYLLAEEITQDLEAALEQFATIAEDLGDRKK